MLPRSAYITFSRRRIPAVPRGLIPRLLSVPMYDILSLTILSQMEKVMNITSRNATAKSMKRSPNSSFIISSISSVSAKRWTFSDLNFSLSISSAASICVSSRTLIMKAPPTVLPQERISAVALLTAPL